MQLVMTLLVRNEEDILEQNIAFHHAQGVDQFIIMDNLSTDGTSDTITSLATEFPVFHLTQAQDDYHQTAWVTEMARIAYTQFGADWVINNDADEFWVPKRGTLKSYLRSLPPDISTVTIHRHNAVVRCPYPHLPGVSHPRLSSVFETESLNALGRPLPRKCLHRGSADVIVHQGNHSVKGVEGRSLALTDEIRILHFPYRSLASYKQKINVGGAAYQRNTVLPASMGDAWRTHYQGLETGTIEKFWSSLSEVDASISDGRIEGRLFADPRLMKFCQLLDAKIGQRRFHTMRGEVVTRTNQRVDDFLARYSSVSAGGEASAITPSNVDFRFRAALAHARGTASMLSTPHYHEVARNFAQLRDCYSLFPNNDDYRDVVRATLQALAPMAARRLRADCHNRPTLLHLSCTKYLDRAFASVRSFATLLPTLHHIVVRGIPEAPTEQRVPLAMDYTDNVLTVPAPDNYDNLHRKLFYALMIVDLIGSPQLVIKIDDDIQLNDAPSFSALVSNILLTGHEYAGKPVGFHSHADQWHGWHIGKCDSSAINGRGYSYPLPRSYASGGFGYALGPRALSATTKMYLSMKEFFAMPAIGLEDAFVGHAMYSAGIDLTDLAVGGARRQLPGLRSTGSL